MKKKILLCYPKNGASAKGVSVFLPLSILTIAAPLSQNYEVTIFDQRLDPYSKFIEALDDNPILVGISTMTGIQIGFGLQLAREAKKRGIPTVWGGVHASLLPEQTVEHPDVDYVVAGEGEYALLSLVKQMEKGIKPTTTILREPIDKLDSLPDLPYHLVDMEQYVHTVKLPQHRVLQFMFSRGCPFNCGFCSSGYLTRRWQAPQVKTALERIHRLVEKYNISYIHFFDENMTSNVNMLHEFATGLPKGIKWMMQSRLNLVQKLDLAKLKECGLDLSSSGLESGSNRILREINKKEKIEEYIAGNRLLAAAGVNSKYSMMMGFPGEQLSDLHASVDLALQVLDENPYASFNPFYVFQPYPGTPLAKQYKVEGCDNLEDWKDFNRHNLKTPFLAGREQILTNLTFSSKYVGRLFKTMFPDDQNVHELTEILRHKWQSKSLESPDWQDLHDRHLEIVQGYFGEDAY